MMRKVATLQVVNDLQPTFDALEKAPTTLDPDSVILAPIHGDGMVPGQLSVALFAKSPSGEAVVVEMLLRLLLSATEQLTKFAGGDPRALDAGGDHNDVVIAGGPEDVPDELPDAIVRPMLVDSLPTAFAAIRELAQVFIAQPPECRSFHADPRQALMCKSLASFRQACLGLEEAAKGMDEARGVIRRPPQAAC